MDESRESRESIIFKSSYDRKKTKIFVVCSGCALSWNSEDSRDSRAPWCPSRPQVSLEHHPRVKITAFERDSQIGTWPTHLWGD